jgi:hypothetical protein
VNKGNRNGGTWASNLGSRGGDRSKSNLEVIGDAFEIEDDSGGN